MKKVFLGGTCNGSTWREELIPMLKGPYFNPVVKNWTSECQAEEILQRESCDYCLYVITPEMMSSYSLVEATDDSNKRPHRTLFCVLWSTNGKEFNKHDIKCLKLTGRIIKENGAKVFESLKEIADWINSRHLIPSDNELTYYKYSDGTEEWYDEDDNLIHERYPDGEEYWYDSLGKVIDAKTSSIKTN